MKKRLPRKLKKAMLTQQRLFDKSLGFKCRRAIMRQYMYQRYLTKLYGISISYNKPITIKDLSIATRLEARLEKIANWGPQI